MFIAVYLIYVGRMFLAGLWEVGCGRYLYLLRRISEISDVSRCLNRRRELVYSNLVSLAVQWPFRIGTSEGPEPAIRRDWVYSRDAEGVKLEL